MIPQSDLDLLNCFLGLTVNAFELSNRLQAIFGETNELEKLEHDEFKTATSIIAELQKAVAELNEWPLEAKIYEIGCEVLSSLALCMCCIRLHMAYVQQNLHDGLEVSHEGEARDTVRTAAVKQRQLRRIERTAGTATRLLQSLAMTERDFTDSIFHEKEKIQASPSLRHSRQDISRLKHDTECLVARTKIRRAMLRCRPRQYGRSIRTPADIERFLVRLCDLAFEAPRRFSSTQPSIFLGRKRRSQRIDRDLQIDREATRNDCHGIVLWSGDSGVESILTRLELAALDSHGRRLEYRELIWQYIVQAAYRLVIQLKETGLYQEFKGCDEAFILIENYPSKAPPDADFATSVDKIFQHPRMTALLANSDTQSELLCAVLCDSGVPRHFLTNVSRVSTPSYIPTDEDITQIRKRFSQGPRQTHFPLGPLNVSLTTMKPSMGERRKWFHQFADPDIVLFVVDMSSYDDVLMEDSTTNRLMEAIIQFHSVITSKWFQETATILVLNGYDEFCEKLGKRPLERFFPAYKGGVVSPIAATKFMLDEFLKGNKENRNVYPVLAADGTSCAHTMFNIIRTVMLEKAVGRAC